MRMGYAVVAAPEVRVITFIQGGCLGELEEDTAAVLVKEIEARLAQGEAELAFFSELSFGSGLFDTIRRSPRWISRYAFTLRKTHRALVLPAQYEGFLHSLSAKTRKHQRRQARKLVKTFPGGVEIRYFSELMDIEQMLGDVEAVARTTYQRTLGVGFEHTLEMRERMTLAAEKGWLRGYLLYLASVPVGFWIGTQYRGVFFSDFMGYDSAYARHSPGMFLIMEVIDRFYGADKNGRVTKVDFGVGDAQYKEVLGNVSWTNAFVYMYAPTLKGIALNASRLLVVLLDKLGRTALERLHLQRQVKKMWREWLSLAPGSCSRINGLL